ncbi:MAG TPA: hypothetical protein VE714_05625 [Gemmatimonadales bacterium]|jgi:hypothetical protein|nr:hypothetical protein [Gemmatimonadales bacterium]
MADRDILAGGNKNGVGSAAAADWPAEDKYWRSNFSSRPYARSDRRYESYQPGYRYGFESANKFRGRQWNEVETDLRAGWDRFEHRGQSTWENVKDAVRDAWDRVTGGERRATTDREKRATY